MPRRLFDCETRKGESVLLGCTNYNKAGTGCSKFVTPKLYYDMFKLTPDPVPAKEFPKAKDISPKYDHSNAAENKKVNVTNEVPTVINKARIKSIAYGESDLNDIVHKILLCLSHVSEKKYYGITTLVDVLRGAQSKKITEADLDKISEYASLKGINREDLVAIIEWLIENHYMLKTKGMYPVLHPTYEGIHYDETITTNKLKKLSEYLSGKE